MWDSVDSIWIPFNKPLEGYLDFMYLDTRNLVTTGMGNLIDPRGVAEALPWYDKNTSEYSSIDVSPATGMGSAGAVFCHGHGTTGVAS